MSNFSSMSYPELVCELIGMPDTTNACAVTTACLASGDARSSSERLVSHKLAVARELMLRDLAARMKSGPVLNSTGTVRDWLRLRYANLEHEVFTVLHLDVQHRLIDAEPLFRGTLTMTSVYPREVVKSVLARNSAIVIFAHNHPSGNAVPSKADRALTQCLRSALAMVDVQVADHFIVAGDTVLSFAENGLL